MIKEHLFEIFITIGILISALIALCMGALMMFVIIHIFYFIAGL